MKARVGVGLGGWGGLIIEGEVPTQIYREIQFKKRKI